MNSAILYVLLAFAALLFGGMAVLLYRGRNASRPIQAPPAAPSITAAQDRAVSDVTTAAAAEVVAPDASELLVAPPLETPTPSAGRLARLRARLARSNSAVGKGLLALLTRDALDDATWDEVEETLLASDLGVGPTQELIAALKRRTRAEGVQDAAGARAMLREELLTLVDPTLDRSLRDSHRCRPTRGAARRRCQRHRQDHDHGKARARARRGRAHRRPRCGRHVPRGSQPAAADLGRPGRGDGGHRRRGSRSRRRGVRRRQACGRGEGRCRA